MTFEDALALGQDTPVKLRDGKFGLLIRWASPDKVGIQVPGEEDIRWVKVENITNNGGVLIEDATP